MVDCSRLVEIPCRCQIFLIASPLPSFCSVTIAVDKLKIVSSLMQVTVLMFAGGISSLEHGLTRGRNATGCGENLKE